MKGKGKEKERKRKGKEKEILSHLIVSSIAIW
jgi:hypothetical protein